MRWQSLLLRAEADLGPGPFPYREFTTGGAWMAAQLYQRIPKLSPVSQPNYHRAGLLKYGFSLLAAGGILLMVDSLAPLAILLSALSFYLVEVHFLFLFPILAEGNEQPYHASIFVTYDLGLLHCVGNVIPIALTMLLGLLNRKDPYRGWHVGCLAVVLWYADYRKSRAYEG